MRISDWSSDVCSSDLVVGRLQPQFLRPLAIARPAEIGRQDSVRCPQLRIGEDASRGRPGNRNRQGRARPILNQPRRIVENRRRDEAIIILRRIVTIAGIGGLRSEEHTSELQSLMRTSYAVFCLKTKKHTNK